MYPGNEIRPLVITPDGAGPGKKRFSFNDGSHGNDYTGIPYIFNIKSSPKRGKGGVLVVEPWIKADTVPASKVATTEGKSLFLFQPQRIPDPVSWCDVGATSQT